MLTNQFSIIMLSPGVDRGIGASIYLTNPPPFRFDYRFGEWFTDSVRFWFKAQRFGYIIFKRQDFQLIVLKFRGIFGIAFRKCITNCSVSNIHCKTYANTCKSLGKSILLRSSAKYKSMRQCVQYNSVSELVYMVLRFM